MMAAEASRVQVAAARAILELGLRVVKVDPEKNLILIKGAVPGANGSLITIRDSVKAAKVKAQ